MSLVRVTAEDDHSHVWAHCRPEHADAVRIHLEQMIARGFVIGYLGTVTVKDSEEVPLSTS